MIDYTTAGGVALLTFDNPPLNVLTPELLDTLCRAVDRANGDPDVKGIVITGTPDHFTSGMDINIFREMKNPEEAEKLSGRVQSVFGHIEASEKPVAAAMAGMVMGGALECALAARFRVCTTTTRCSMPEITLGILPGAGGTQRLPRLVGPEKAFGMMLSGRPVAADDALAAGLVDAVTEPSKLLDTARRMVLSGDIPERSGRRTGNISDTVRNEAAFESAGKTACKVHPEIIAPHKIIQAVRTGITGSFEAGLESERKGFAACMATTAAKNRISNFFASRATAKVDELASVKPSSVATVAIIGMGTMGSGIAQTFAAADKTVLVSDIDRAHAEKGVAVIEKSLARKVSRGFLNREKADAILGRIIISDEWKRLAEADLVIEAVVEDTAIKQALFETIGAVCTPETVIASNTSTIDLDLFAEKLPRPERLVGMHFFNPAHSMPLVEVIRRKESDPAVVATVLHLTGELRKTPVLVNNSVGFVVNRLFIPYAAEAYRLLEEGAGPEEIDAAMTGFGFPMGPLALIDMTGIDILAFTTAQLCAAFPRHIPLPAVAAKLVDEGLLGQKSGCGVYRYEEGSRKPLPSGRTAEIIGEIKTSNTTPHRSFTREQITDRLVFRLVAEGFRVAEERVALREADIDVAMVLGIGFPDFRGGVIRFAHDRGLKNVIKKLESLASGYGERYEPCNYLQSIIQE